MGQTTDHDSGYIAPEAWADRVIDRAPRLALLALVALAWAVTLDWPPPPAGSRPLVAGQDGAGHFGSYPLRLDLPRAQPVAADELAGLAERHEAIAQLGLSLPGTAGAGEPARATGFAAAFASLIDGGAQRASQRPSDSASVRELAPGEMLPLDYDLAKLVPSQPRSEAATRAGARGEARFNAEDGSLTVSKPLLVDGKSRGNATIRIEEGAQIYIATASVADALGSQAETLPRRISGALATRTGFIPFHELRGAGIAVEYDPVTDRVSLSTNS